MDDPLDSMFGGDAEERRELKTFQSQAGPEKHKVPDVSPKSDDAFPLG